MELKKGMLSLALTALISVGFIGCGDANKAADDTSEEVHFSYFGANGPTHWADLKSEWDTCSNGLTLTDVDPLSNHQSPVNFTANATKSSPNFTLDVNRDLEFTIVNNGHAIEAELDAVDADKDSINIGGKDYFLKQFHFHAYSEHTENNVPAAIETHFVFKATDGTLAVLGLFVDRNATTGTENAELAKVFNTTLPEANEEGEKVSINVASLLPSTSNVYSYSGSLTTPPCTEGVAWNVYTVHTALTESQVVNFTKHYHNNFRPVTGNW